MRALLSPHLFGTEVYTKQQDRGRTERKMCDSVLWHRWRHLEKPSVRLFSEVQFICLCHFQSCTVACFQQEAFPMEARAWIHSLYHSAFSAGNPRDALAAQPSSPAKAEACAGCAVTCQSKEPRGNKCRKAPELVLQHWTQVVMCLLGSSGTSRAAQSRASYPSNCTTVELNTSY